MIRADKYAEFVGVDRSVAYKKWRMQQISFQEIKN